MNKFYFLFFFISFLSFGQNNPKVKGIAFFDDIVTSNFVNPESSTLEDNVDSVLLFSAQDPLTKSVSIYPNPVRTNKLFVKTNQELKVDIYDVLGKVVASKKVFRTNDYIDISKLNRGYYLVKLTTKNSETVTKKLVRQ